MLAFEMPETARTGGPVHVDVTHTEELGVQHVVELRVPTADGGQDLVARTPGLTPLAARIQARRRAGRVVDE
jgi:hypothetical protein